MKTFGKSFLASAIVIIFTIQANAQNNGTANQSSQKQPIVNSSRGNFADKDNNEICDNFENRSGRGGGANFIDKNNDGICDNRANIGNRAGNKLRKGHDNQNRNGKCRGPRNCGRR